MCENKLIAGKLYIIAGGCTPLFIRKYDYFDCWIGSFLYKADSKRQDHWWNGFEGVQRILARAISVRAWQRPCSVQKGKVRQAMQ